MPLKTLFLNPPSFENFDGGAGSRWPATREIESYWYPVWLAYPAGMLEGSRLLDAPPHHISAEQTIEIGKQYEFLVLFTSTPGFAGDCKLAAAMKAANPRPQDRLRRPACHHLARAIAARRGRPSTSSSGANSIGQWWNSPMASRWRRYWASRIARMNASSTIPTVRCWPTWTLCPNVTDVYKRDLDVTRYNVPFLLHPFVALYTTRGCPAQCTFCLWPQTLSGHPWRKRSAERHRGGDGQGQEVLAQRQGILFR